MGVVTKNLNAIRPREILLVIQQSQLAIYGLLTFMCDVRIIQSRNTPANILLIVYIQNALSQSSFPLKISLS
jgi:hypothetical protein